MFGEASLARLTAESFGKNSGVTALNENHNFRQNPRNLLCWSDIVRNWSDIVRKWSDFMRKWSDFVRNWSDIVPN
ncbi:MAG: hypothetical protein RR595_03890 [Lysinibacillus sp.]